MRQKAEKGPLARRTPRASNQDELEALKGLLLGEERRQLDQIDRRLTDPSLRAEDLADALPDAVRLRDQRDDELTEALEAPVTQCIDSAIRHNPENFARALYPVMGPAIRQSIANTLRGLVENINRTLEHSLSSRGLRWRLEAMRSGVPFGEVVLRHTLVYRVEQVFLIQPGSGLLMQHAADELAVGGDRDAISGMLTAITQFVRDAFAAGEGDALENIEMGDHTVLLVHGPHAYLAAVVRGIPPHGLREQCQSLLEQLHVHYKGLLEGFDGNPERLAPLQHRLEKCLISQQRESERRNRRSPILVLLGLLILGAFAWWSWNQWQEHRATQALLEREQALVSQLEKAPGVMLSEVRYGPTLRIRGLKDPLAPSVDPLLTNSGLQASQIDLQMRPYLDLDPSLIVERARRKLKPPPSVTLSLNRDRLILRGNADDAWVKHAHLAAPLLPGVNEVDDSALVSPDQYLLEEAKRRLAPLPEGVALAAHNGRLRLSGQAPLEWIAGSDKRLEGLPGLEGVDRQGLAPAEAAEYESLRSRIDQRALYFSDSGAELGDKQQPLLDALARELRRLQELGRTLERPFHVIITGRTDGVGAEAYNKALAEARARAIREQLVSRGVPPELLETRTRIEERPILDPQLRRVDLAIAPLQD